MQLKKFLILLIVLLFSVLQSTVLYNFQFFEIKPDLLLILVIYFSLTWGRVYGLAVGFLCGLFTECTSNIPAGLGILFYSFGGLVLGYVGKWVYNQTLLIKFAVTFSFSLLINSAVLFFLNKNLLPGYSFLKVALPASFYTASIAPFLFFLLKIVFPAWSFKRS